MKSVHPPADVILESGTYLGWVEKPSETGGVDPAVACLVDPIDQVRFDLVRMPRVDSVQLTWLGRIGLFWLVWPHSLWDDLIRWFRSWVWFMARAIFHVISMGRSSIESDCGSPLWNSRCQWKSRSLPNGIILAKHKTPRWDIPACKSNFGQRNTHVILFKSDKS